MSEDFAVSHGTPPDEVTRQGYVGKRKDGVSARIDVNGEILIKSPGNMMGYFKQPELTAECYTEDGYFRTGDMGEYDADGYLRITGRVKELFKTRKGKYVAPVPIENRLMAHPRIETVCVTGVGQPATCALAMPDEATRNALASGESAAKLRAQIEQELSTLLEQTNAELEPHERVKFIAVVGETWTIANGMLTPTMKIKRSAIEHHYADQFPTWFARPDTIIWGGPG